MSADVFSILRKPAWLGLIVLSVLCAAGAALWVGLQRDAGESSTTYVYTRHVGNLNRPLTLLDDNLNDIVNSVEFPIVFERIEERLNLRAEKDYKLEIGVTEEAESMLEITVKTQISGEADRIARIVAEEMVAFVLEEQNASVSLEIDDLTTEVARLEEEQAQLVSLAGGAPPTAARRSLEAQLVGLVSDPNRTTAGPLEGAIQDQLAAIIPLASSYTRNATAIGQLHADRARSLVERNDIIATQNAINEEWYRSITPVEPTSNVPVAIAMAFAAAVPAGVVAVGLVALNIDRRLGRSEEQDETHLPQAA